MTAKKQAPHEAVRWVLNFLNLGCIPGEPNPWRLPYEKRKLKRPPLPQNPSGLKKVEKIPGFPSFVDIEKKYVWGRNDKGEYSFDGKDSAPTTEDFRGFFLEHGIPPIKGEDITLCGNIKIKDWETRKQPADRNSKEFLQWLYFPTPGEKARIQIIELWKELSDLFLGVAWASDAKKREGGYESFKGFVEHILKLYRECLEEDELPAKDYKSNRDIEGYLCCGVDTIINRGLLSIEPFFHYGDLPQALYAIILGFANHFRESYQCLRQCQLCGSFWIKNDKRESFCLKVCNDVFNKQSRHSNSRSASASKKARRNRKKKNDYNAIKEFYVKTGHSIEEAAIYANEWICVEGKTLESFKKEQGKR